MKKATKHPQKPPAEPQPQAMPAPPASAYWPDLVEEVRAICDQGLLEGYRPTTQFVARIRRALRDAAKLSKKTKKRRRRPKKRKEPLLQATASRDEKMAVRLWYQDLAERLRRRPRKRDWPAEFIDTMGAVYDLGRREGLREAMLVYQDVDLDQVKPAPSPLMIRLGDRRLLVGRHAGSIIRRSGTFKAAMVACDRLCARGERPGARGVYRELHRGNMRTLQAAVDAWWVETAERLYNVKLFASYPAEIYHIAARGFDAVSQA